jgi:hypothetical protein
MSDHFSLSNYERITNLGKPVCNTLLAESETTEKAFPGIFETRSPAQIEEVPTEGRLIDLPPAIGPHRRGKADKRFVYWR